MNRAFRIWATSTIVAIYAVIVLGGLVRATGSGLGCPDWPKCYGSWIPPTGYSDLPADVASEMVNLTKTWIEYINRMVGVLCGIFVLITTVLAFRLGPSHKAPRNLMLGALLMIAFQGWLGGQVVKHELTPALVSLHMFLAIGIVVLVIWASERSRRNFSLTASPLLKIGALFTLVLVVQMILGTFVRAEVEALEMGSALPRDNWLPLGWWPDIAHRQFSIVTLVIGIFFFRATQQAHDKRTRNFGRLFAALLGLQMATGLIMAYMGLPRASQITHLLGATLLASLVFVATAAAAPTQTPKSNHD